MSQTAHEEEAIRSIVAECVGRLFVIYSADMEKVISEGLNSGNPKMIATLAKSFKYSGIRATDELMLQIMSKELARLLLENSDLEVKRNTYEAVATIIHNNAGLMKQEFSDLQEQAKIDTEVKKELIEEVDLGPFKQKYDHGIPIRSAAYRMLETMYDRAKEHINIIQTVDIIYAHGLIDTSEECVVMNLNLLVKIS
jgi:cullin-associated NEDD8-dissociated protein 1